MQEQETLEILLEIPKVIHVDKETLTFYQPSLGATLLIGNAVKALEIEDFGIITTTALYLAVEKPNEVNTVIALHTLNTKQELTGETLLRQIERISKFSAEDRATLLIMCLSTTKSSVALKEHYGLTREHEYIRKAIKAKDSKSTFSFCGMTIYGSVIGQAAEKYGWSYDYIMWGISYLNLEMMLADAPQTVYLDENERRKACIPRDRKKTKADDPNNQKAVEDFIRLHS